jgi:uncharacterized FlaG/YvyC family protein
MKITDRKATDGAADARPLKTFGEVLSKTKPAAGRGVAAARLAAANKKTATAKGRLTAAQTTAQRTLDRSSKASSKAEKTLGDAHSRSACSSRGREEQRADDSIRASLFRELERQEKSAAASHAPAPSQDRDSRESSPTPAASAAEGASQSSSPSQQAPVDSSATSAAAQRAEAISALVERIEAALKDGKPTLSLALHEKAAAGAVEITRAAKGEVSVRIRARKGDRAGLRSEADAIKQALEAKGLKVKALEIS